MNRTLVAVPACLLVAAAALLPTAREGHAQGSATARPKTILLGFDGVDHRLTRQWIESGDLPNMARLADRGSFVPLETANPAQSPVSWAVLETASNPGKTNIHDFVRRENSPVGPTPKLAGVKREMVERERIGEYVPLDGANRLVLTQTTGAKGTLLVIALGALVFLLVAGIGSAVLRLPGLVAIVCGLVFGSGIGFAGKLFLAELPPRMPVPVPEMQGERFWDVLGRAGVRVTGLQVPAAFPCAAHDNAKLLSGLFTPDVGGGPGAWFIYTNDEWTVNETSTTTGGTVYKLYEDPDGVVRNHLYGPVDFVRQDRVEAALKGIDARLAEPGLADAERQTLERERAVAADELRKFQAQSRVRVPFEIVPDYANQRATIRIAGRSETVAEGKWSDYFRVSFPFTKLVTLNGIARVFVTECSFDADQNPRLELFVPPMSISPEEPPPVAPISSPAGYAAELAADIGLYDTVGWACYTNALKDEEIPEQAFMDGLEFVLGWRTRMLERELARKDWDVLFHVESVTDRAGHLLYRYMDELHPQHDAEDLEGNLLRDKLVTAYGRTFPLKDGIKETYREMDRIVGSVLDRIEAGEFGDDALLMVVSDHGFQPFRHGVNLNVWLHRMGYLVGTGDDSQGTVGGLVAGKADMLGQYVDWSKTKAYSMGLGKIYINLQGRETHGIVTPEEFEPLKDEIIAKLETFTDPRPGHEGTRVVKRAYDAADIYTGDHITEGGDIIVGFDEGYRVSWQTTLGGYEKKTYDAFGIGPNPEPWTGDHCGVDPSLVQGIYFSNRPIPENAQPGLTSIAPTILARYGVAPPAEWDGQPIQ